MTLSKGVLAFVDYENLRQSISRYFVEKVTAQQVAKAIKDIAEELGDFRGGTFFGDWTRRAQDARHIEESGFRAENVLMSRSGKDRADIPMALQMDDIIRQRPDIHALLLCSGDAGFAEVVRRARGYGKRVFLGAVTVSAARELMSLAEQVFPIEARLDLTAKPAQLPLTPQVTDFRRCIERLDSLEAKLPYVVWNYFRDSILDPSLGCGETVDEKNEFLNKAVEEGIIIREEVPNPRLPGRVVTTCRLNRQNDLVQQVLPQK